uniref:Uncharacterized protein n=1 Tax=Sinocyclocheilus grahami TaxID=75366 RepID=A0A672PQC4_SINGR
CAFTPADDGRRPSVRYGEKWRTLKCSRESKTKHRSRIRSTKRGSFQRWRELKEREGLRSDAEVALFLLERVSNIVLMCACPVGQSVHSCIPSSPNPGKGQFID